MTLSDLQIQSRRKRLENLRHLKFPTFQITAWWAICRLETCHAHNQGDNKSLFPSRAPDTRREPLVDRTMPIAVARYRIVSKGPPFDAVHNYIRTSDISS